MESHSRVAGGSISPSRFVTLSSADGKVVQCTAATDKIYGVSQQGTRRAPGTAADDGFAAIVNENILIYGMGANGVLLELGGTVLPGDKLTSDANGKGIATVTNLNEYGATAEVNGVSGELIYVEVKQGQISLA